MREILLMSFLGPDQPNQFTRLMSILEQHGLDLLDAGQGVIHDQLTLGLVVSSPSAEATALAMRDMLFIGQELGLTVRFEPISHEQYQKWVCEGGQPRHIVTVIARHLSPSDLQAVTRVISRHGFNIETLSRLSGRVDATPDTQARNCMEFGIRGTASAADGLKRDCLILASQRNIDIAVQEDNIYRRNRRLVCFDMDSTLIEQEVIDELAHEAGVGGEVAAITEQAMRGELDFQQSFRQRLSLLKGLDESVLARIAQRLTITEGAERLISTLKALGYRTAIISGGFEYFARHLQERLGIDEVYANRLAIRDGKVTGEVEGDIVDGQMKARILRQLAERDGISLQQTIAVGDGANDLPMLTLAGLGIAFRAKPLVRENASQAISSMGLDGILYLLGVRDYDLGPRPGLAALASVPAQTPPFNSDKSSGNTP